MSTENVEKFFELLATDEALRTQVSQMLKDELGEDRDEARALAALEARVIPLARQRGLEFTREELVEYGEKARNTQGDGTLCDDEMEAVAGGVEVKCIIVGKIDDKLTCYVAGKRDNHLAYCTFHSYTCMIAGF